MLHLSDTSIRIYRKKNGKASFRLKSYLMVKTNVWFSLSAYLRSISCKLILPNGEVIEFDEVSVAENLTCKYQLETMVHDFCASGIADMDEIKNGIGTLRLDYNISFTGHGKMEPGFFEVIVPLIRRTSKYVL